MTPIWRPGHTAVRYGARPTPEGLSMFSALYGRIAHILPPSVKRVVKAMILVHASPSEALPARPRASTSSGRQTQSGGELTERLRNRAKRSESKLERTESARDRIRGQRDTARKDLASSRRKLVKLRRDTSEPAEQWWEQRLLLAGRDTGIGLRDFAYFPGGAQNPYLRLMYSRLPEAGFDPRPLGKLDHLYRLPDDSVFHLHWTRVAQLGATTTEDAKDRTAVFLDPIEDFVGRGGLLLWSIHEPLPHDCAFPDVERELRGRLGELATGIHILHEATLVEVADEYDVPTSKVFVIEHPLYNGAYERIVPRPAARKLLGLGDDEVMVLCLGAIRPYKGFDRLVEMIPQLETEAERTVRVMIAGPTMASIDLSGLYTLVDKTKGATISAEAVADQQLHVLLEAADVMALPYRAVLNSGVLMLGVTFGKICVAPKNAVTDDVAASGLVELFDAPSNESLATATVRAINRARRPHSIDRGFADRYEPTAIAGRFTSHVADLAGESA